MQKRMKKQTIVAVVAAAALAGCAAPQAYTDLMLKARNGFQDMTIEVSPAVSKVARIEELRIEGDQTFKHNFNALGFVTYGKSCKVLTLHAKFYSTNGTALGTAQAMLLNYVAKERTKFNASFLSTPTSRQELISKGVIDSIQCQ